MITFMKSRCCPRKFSCFYLFLRPVKTPQIFFEIKREIIKVFQIIYNPYPTAFPYGNGMVLHFYQQQESSTTKTVHKVINKGLKAYV